MGNCSFKGFDASLSPIRVMTSSGQVLEFFGPKLVSEVVKDFPRHGIFRKGHLLSPLDHCEQLIGGQFYYLFPLAPEERTLSPEERDRRNEEKVANESEPVRMSTSAVALQLVTKKLSDGSGFEVLPPPRKGVWKVKLVINTKQLEEILSEEVNTEALIEQMRAAVGSTKVVPRWSKGYWGVKLKPILCNVLNKTVVDDGFLSPKSVTPLLQ